MGEASLIYLVSNLNLGKEFGGVEVTFALCFDKNNRKIFKNRLKGTPQLTLRQLFIASTGSGAVRWKFVHGLFENAIYGGRIDNTFDAKVLLSYLLQYFEQAVFPGQVS